MSNTITQHGSVPVEIGGKPFLNLTGSSTELTLGNESVLIDAGLSQGVEGSDVFNYGVIRFGDVIVITHPHIDHVGKLPLLYKNGFRGDIYMTEASRAITIEMLLDSLKIQEREQKTRFQKNKRLKKRLKRAFLLKESILKYESDDFDDLSMELKEKIISYIKVIFNKNGKKGKEVYTTNDFNDLCAFLDAYGIKETGDINKLIKKLNEPIYEKEDIDGIIGCIKPLDYLKETVISDKKISVRNKNLKNQKLLEELPEKVANGYSDNIKVETIQDKNKLIGLWKEKQKQEIEKTYNNEKIQELVKKLKKELETAYNFLFNQYNFGLDSADINHRDFKNNEEFILMRMKKNLYQKLLGVNGINLKNKGCIDRFINDKEKVIDLLQKEILDLKLDIVFNNENIQKASKLIKIEIIGNRKEVVKLTFTDAAHIVGSASVNLVYKKIKGSVNSLLEDSSIGVFLSGDLGRMNLGGKKNNRLGEPELPTIPVDVFQIESTYGGKEHISKEKAVKELINIIERSNGNILTLGFAQQRIQELLMSIGEENLKKQEKGEKLLKVIVDSPLAEKLTNIYIKHKGDIYNLLSEEDQKKVFGKVVFRFLERGEIDEIYKEQKTEENKKKSKIADINTQIKNLEGKELERDKLKGLKEQKEKLEKEIEKLIVFASSGMATGGPVMGHLPYILEDKNATLIAPGYLTNGTLGNEIINEKKKKIKIIGKQYEVKCKTKFIDGFSSHISHYETLEFIVRAIKQGKFKQNCTISLNHGNKGGQELLKQDIEYVLKYYNREDISVIIPGMNEEYNIDKREFKKGANNKIKKNNRRRRGKKINVPNFLKGELKIHKEEKSLLDSSKIFELKKKNTGSINEIKTKILIEKGQLEKGKKKFLMSYFLSVLFIQEDSKSILNQIQKLGKSQKIDFYRKIENHINGINKAKNSISNLKEKEDIVNKIINNLIDFINDFNELVTENIYSLKERINQIILDIERLKKDCEAEKLFYRFNERIKGQNIDIRVKKYDLDNRKKHILAKEKELEKLKSKLKIFIEDIKKEKENFKNNLKSYLPSELKGKLTIAFNILGNENSNKKEFISLVKEISKEAKEIIQRQVKNRVKSLDSHMKISFFKRILNFAGRNLYKELIEDNKGRLDVEKLEKLIKKAIFYKEEINFLSNNLREYIKEKGKQKVNKNLTKKPINKIKRFFKKKQKENEDLGIDFELSVEDLQEEILSILSNLFDEKYFKKYIYPNFNIYLFLKSKQNLEDFIKNNYNLEKLKGVLDSLNNYDSQLQKSEKIEETLERLNTQNHEINSLEELEDIEKVINKMIN